MTDDDSDVSDALGSDVDEPTIAILNNFKQWEKDSPASTYRSAFDAYFAQASTRSRTSANVFSSRVLSLTAEEHNAAIAAYKARPESHIPETNWAGPWDQRTAFSRFARELDEGFSLLFYGFGSKRALLNTLAVETLAHRGHVIVINGFQPNITLKDILASIEQVPGVLQSAALSSGGAEKQTQRIQDFFSATSASASTPHLYLVVHNIDAPAMRAAKTKHALAALALVPHIHLVASADRLNTPLLWSASEVAARKDAAAKRGYNWLWHDLTTLAPYDFELAFANRTSLSGASAGARGAQDTAVSGAPITETAAAHVLAAVTQKAKKLFALLGARQLENIDAAGEDALNGNVGDLQQFGLAYDVLFTTAREAFVATNDTALRALLGEFRDHGLVVSAAQGGPSGGEVLWIPLRRERLARILQTLGAEQ
ncbi:origin recognition complex, subunit 2 [Hygrophoropsis aurantiaca]|uniref:Origin recognition complex, subunit 2 n=1 Tax=Hygrophoropsis aurantiaca TaxID=72124 RepID=A0ACB7ZV33_9AGAM|nr:origin recognition complex, subunit 2 [Hygrophoropsis aurantiaca]